MIQLPIPPNVLGFPEPSMPVVKYNFNGEVRKGKFTGRWEAGNTVEILRGYVNGFGVTVRIPANDILEVVQS